MSDIVSDPLLVITIVGWTVAFWIAMVKAGLPGPLALTCLIPGFGMLIVAYIFALSPWPNVEET